MSTTPTVPVRTATLEVPDGRLYFEVRGDGPLVALIASPMDARAFAPLADLLATDRTVLTTDPRGIGRSVLHDPTQTPPPSSAPPTSRASSPTWTRGPPRCWAPAVAPSPRWRSSRHGLAS